MAQSMQMSHTLVDLSHTVYDGLETYRGLPSPVISDYLSREDSRVHYSPGTEFHIGKIEMVANTGTYLDAPFHRFEQGADLAEIPLASLADLPGVLVDARETPDGAIGKSHFRDLDLAGKAVLVFTGWSHHWATDRYFEGSPFLTESAAEYLIERSVALVGIDSLNIDDVSDGRRPVHSRLLDSGILIVEHLTNLDQLPPGDFRFFCVPVKIKGMGSFPARAFAIAG